MQKALGLLLSPRLWLGLLLALVFSGLATYWWASTRLAQPINLPEPDYIYTVADGSHLAGLAKDLEAKGIIPSALLLRVYARLSQQQSIHRGEFALDQSLNSMTLLAKLCSSDVVQHRITLLEGWRYQQALDYLHSKQNIKAELKGLDWAAQQQKLGFELAHPEGYFFPDTYRYHAGESDVSILRRAHRKLNWVLAQQWQKRAKNLPYESPYEALIMASIIEKETGLDVEREQIAGVFVRRLNKGMRLQTDPTVIYGMGDNYKGNIRRKDLRQPTPYNTYVIYGLPPTPIALAGERAIYAALHPAAGKALFFVAKGDGSHQFSETLAQHNKAVRQYQLRKRRKNYRSAPAD